LSASAEKALKGGRYCTCGTKEGGRPFLQLYLLGSLRIIYLGALCLDRLAGNALLTYPLFPALGKQSSNNMEDITYSPGTAVRSASHSPCA